MISFFKQPVSVTVCDNCDKIVLPLKTLFYPNKRPFSDDIILFGLVVQSLEIPLFQLLDFLMFLWHQIRGECMFDSVSDSLGIKWEFPSIHNGRNFAILLLYGEIPVANITFTITRHFSALFAKNHILDDMKSLEYYILDIYRLGRLISVVDK